MKNTCCLILSAGESSRFGKIKQLSLLNGIPIVNRLVNEVKKIFDQDVFLVLGAYKEKIQPLIENDVNIIINNEWQIGIGSSISVGIKKISAYKKYHAVLIVLVDQVHLCSEDFMLLMQSFDGNKIVATKYEDSVGVPAIFPMSFSNELKKLKDDYGAKFFLNNNITLVKQILLPNSLKDMNTPEDFLNLKKI